MTSQPYKIDIQRAIRRGAFKQIEEGATERIGDNSWVINALFAVFSLDNPQRQARSIEILKTSLASTSLDREEKRQVFTEALTQQAWTCLPILHECGWKIDEDASEVKQSIWRRQTAEGLGYGQWTHPELFFPDLFTGEKASSQLRDLFLAMFNKERGLHTHPDGHLDRLVLLDVADTDIISAACASALAEQVPFYNPGVMLDCEGTRTLMEAGWIDEAKVAYELSEANYLPEIQTSTLRLLNKMREDVLLFRVNEATGRTRGMRL